MHLRAHAAAALLAATILIDPSAPALPAHLSDSSGARGFGAYNTAVAHTTSFDTLVLGQGGGGARALLDQYWGTVFSQSRTRRPYTAPGISWLNEGGGTATGCGDLDARDAMAEAAFYCGFDKVMYYDITFLRALDATYGSQGVKAVMAHEQAHHVQRLLGVSFATTRQKELQADCLAGAFMKWHSSLMPTDGEQISLDNLEDMFDELGDPPNVPRTARNAHGSGYDRMLSFDEGWSHGLRLRAATFCFRSTAAERPAGGCKGCDPVHLVTSQPSSATGVLGRNEHPLGRAVVADSSVIMPQARSLVTRPRGRPTAAAHIDPSEQ